MNCANHADASAVAYCRTCGKALCNTCTRPVRGVIYCEDCLGARMEGTIPPIPPAPPVPPPPPSVYQQVTDQGSGMRVPPAPGAPPAGAAPNPPGTGTGPNPTVAGILSGIFPFGVGPVYNGQYTKGLAYLLIMALLFYGADHAGGADVFFGLGIAFFWVYQIVDSVRSAKAIQLGLPAPDPLGVAQAFGTGDKVDTKRIPIGATVLILLGILLLLHTLGFAEFGMDRYWPLVLILIGGWMLARNFGVTDPGRASLGDPRCRSKRLMGPALVLTLGILLLLSTLNVAHFGRTWPVILLVVGAVKLLQGSSHRSDSGTPTPPATSGPSQSPPATGIAGPPASEEANRG
jgi:hypothetical protein